MSKKIMMRGNLMPFVGGTTSFEIPKIVYTEEQYFTFVPETGTITGYNPAGGLNVVIPPTINNIAVTAIGSSAFSSKGLTSVEMPDGIKSIASYAFSTNALTGVTLPSSMTDISIAAFAGNTITSVTFAGSTVNILDHDRWTDPTIGVYGDALKTLYDASEKEPGTYIYAQSTSSWYNQSQPFTFQKTTGTIIGYNAAANPNHVVTIPATINGVDVTHIGNNAFLNKLIENVIIPEGIETIGVSAFSTNALTSVTLPSSMTDVGVAAFAGNTITSVTFAGSTVNIIDHDQWTEPTIGVYGDSLKALYSASEKEPGTYIYAQSTSSWYNQSQPFTFQKSTGTIIGYNAAANPEHVVTIPAIINGVPVTHIGGSAFANKGIISVVIPEGINTIGASAFTTNALTSVTFPASMTNINIAAFAGNTITSVTMTGNAVNIIDHDPWTEPTIGIHGDSLKALYDSSEKEPGTYIYAESTSSWYNQSQPFTFQKSTGTIIGYNAAANPNHIVTIPATINGIDVTHIGNSAFANKGIISVVIPEGINTIGASAFITNALTSVTFPASMENINICAFAGNTIISVTMVGNKVNIIPHDSFTDPTIGIHGDSLKALYDDSEKEPGTYIYAESTLSWYNQSQPFTFQKSTGTIIGYNAAANPNHIVTIPEKIPATLNGVPVTHIGGSAFANKGIVSVVIPEGIQSIASHAFGTNELTSVTFPASMENIDICAFENNTITSVTMVGNKVNIIAHDSFTGPTIGVHGDSLKALYDASEKEPGTYIYAESTSSWYNQSQPFTFQKSTGTIIGYNAAAGITPIIPTKINNIDVVAIGPSAFENKGLTSVVIPDGIRSIASYAFRTNLLTSITFPNSMENINIWAFSGNTITSVTMTGNKVNIIAHDPWTEPTIGVYGDSLKALYDASEKEPGTYIYAESTSSWYNQSQPFTFQKSTGTIIGYNTACSYGLNPVVPATINDTAVTTIGANAFASKLLTSVVIPEGIETIAAYAFSTNALTGITFPSSMTDINNAAFENNPIISITTLGNNINIPDHVYWIGQTIGDHGDAFKTFYYASERVAGTYTWSNEAWTKS